jgi:hypothetical protein
MSSLKVMTASCRWTQRVGHAERLNLLLVRGRLSACLLIVSDCCEVGRCFLDNIEHLSNRKSRKLPRRIDKLPNSRNDLRNGCKEPWAAFLGLLLWRRSLVQTYSMLHHILDLEDSQCWCYKHGVLLKLYSSAKQSNLHYSIIYATKWGAISNVFQNDDYYFSNEKVNS